MVEIAFPIEFVVDGVPASVQASTRSRRAWMARVRQASLSALPEGHFATAAPLAITLLFFPEQMTGADLDNLIKPVLDALNRHVYLDDRQVERILAQRIAPGLRYRFERSPLLTTASLGFEPRLYIPISEDILEGFDVVRRPETSRGRGPASHAAGPSGRGLRGLSQA